jgi:hypothetical protein
MTNTRQTMGALVLITAGMMALPAAAQNDAGQAKKPESISGTQQASCLLKIVTDPGVISLSNDAIEYLIQSSNVRDRAVKDVLGVTGGDYNVQTGVLEQTEIEGPPRERRTLMSLNVNLGEGMKPVARELMDALVINLRNVLERAYQSEMGRMDSQIQLGDREVMYADSELKEVQQKLTDLSDRDLSSDALRSNIAGIQAQLQSLQLERVSQEAYREGIVKRISEIQMEVEKTVANDVIADELKQVIQRRMIELKNAQQKIDAGVVPSGELATVEDKLATARIDLARRREELSKTGSAAGLGQLTAELSTLTLERNRTQAKEEQLLSQFDEARGSLGRSAEYERVKLKLDVAKQNLREAETLFNRARQKVRMLPSPSVSVIGE